MLARLFKRRETNWSQTPMLALVRGRGRKPSPVELPDVVVYRSGNIIYVQGW
jgi:hypothetical protein